MAYRIFAKINALIHNILLGLIAFLLARLIYVLFLLGIQLVDTQKIINGMFEIMKALARKSRINI